jgi:dTDP-glucose 4,6-dehydratase
MEKIFVVGSNSFSGSSFIKFALMREASVIGISRSKEPVNSLAPHKWVNKKSFSFHQLDLNQDFHKIIELILQEKPSYVLNYAAQSMVAESWSNPSDWFMTNVVSTVKLHDELRKMQFLKRYVHITTPEVYGSCAGFIDERHAFDPSTPYAVSRAAADMSLRTFFQTYKFPVVSTRAANVYGPGQQLYRIIPRTILFLMLGKKIQLHGGGTSTRSFIFIDDVSDATWRIMESGSDGGEYHISTERVISIRDLVEMICRKMDKSFNDCVEVVGERLGKDAAYHLSSNKLRSELSWSDSMSLENGIDVCINWVRSNLDELSLESFDYSHRA